MKSKNAVAMNVDFIEGGNYSAAENTIVLEKPVTRFLEMSGSSNSSSFRCYEDSSKIHSKKAVVFLPYSEYCTDHKDLFLHEDDKLVKPGDKFKSHDDFVQYLNEHAKRWCFYYRCTDSRRPNTDQESYTYNCVYLRNKEKYKKKGLRKRNSNNMKTDCPCKIKLRHLPNEDELTVVYVCNHHDHELSLDNFYKLQHGRRLPPYVKEEIKDFLQLKVDIMKIRSYVEMETGFTMSRPFFYTLEKNLKSRNIKRHISEQRLNMLKQKIAAVDEMYGYNEEYIEEEDNGEDEMGTSKKKHQLLLKNAEKAMRTPSLKRRSKTNEDKSKRIKTEEHSDSNETMESVKHLQESVEEEESTWIADQCVPNRTENEETMHIEAIENLPEDALLLVQSDNENYSYTIEYFPDESNNEEVVTNEFGEGIDDSQVTEVQENDIDNIAYETVVSDAVEESQSEVPEYLEDEQTMEEFTEMQIIAQEQAVEDESQVHDGELENQVQYIAGVVENNENVQYVSGEVNDDGTQNITVQAAENSGTTHSLLPVFDVYMKDGNVTGFLVNDNLIAGLKEGVHKEIQTSAEELAGNSQEAGKADGEGQVIPDLTQTKSGDIYTKHEYVHKYNIDKYMVQPHFPKYIETLAKETYMDVLQMFTNIYNEKAMFKITTTQKGKEGNTRIWYIKDTHRTKKQRQDETHKEKLGQNLQCIFLLKEKLRYLKKKNSELIIKNKQLEEVALRLVRDDVVSYASVRD
ncbi:uncharacterized protein LOC110379167 isoform X2 [Helicoverpa armigera]|uniref:uncharacterized protein LOC110379167 isoform X2 n=1 Tax=Helicoverpa armigera TaxID=29058 RepID=UPI003082B72A